ncbi:MAG: thioredoxin [Actinomycetia bacterium]|nr:thioredoxin [Actinomycetes bacterium]
MVETLETRTRAAFDAWIAEQAGPVVVDFWAPWCGPCRWLSPTLAAIAAEQAGRVRFAKLNVDEAPEVAAGLGIMSIPTVIRFDGGTETARVVGALPRETLVRRLNLGGTA